MICRKCQVKSYFPENRERLSATIQVCHVEFIEHFYPFLSLAYQTTVSIITLCMLGNYSCFSLFSADFFSKLTFSKILLGKIISLRPGVKRMTDVLSVLISF